MKNFRLLLIYACLISSSGLFSCFLFNNTNGIGKNSRKTGIRYSEETFLPKKHKERTPAPGLVLIPGGTFMMGGGEKDIEYTRDNRTRQVTVQSFYIDEVEVSNVDWHEFLTDIIGGTESFYQFLSDTIPCCDCYKPKREMQLGMSRGLGAIESNDPTAIDLTRFEELLPDLTVWCKDLAFNDPIAEQYFNHPAFYTYPVVGINWHQANAYCRWRTDAVNKSILEEDEGAILYPAYRLPTEAEWEYAARGLMESSIYAWEGKSLRNHKGMFRANFKHGRGDYSGWRGNGNRMSDRYMITAPVSSFWPNDFGLYNMSGNVAEWTQDTYRILAYEDVEDINPYRRQGKTEIEPDQWLDDVNYKQKESLLFNPDPYNPDSDIFDNVKVVRGGSWKDIAYYLSPGARRKFHADSAGNYIGFRCAMIKTGSPE